MSFIVSQLTMIFLPILALILSHNVRAQVTFVPPAIPLAVRSPYLNCWLQSGNSAIYGQTWPTTFKFSQSQILGWSALVRVDGQTYSFLGDVDPHLYNGTVNFTSIAITPTQTVLVARAGPMQVNLTFLNPIEPQDWVKQSIPFSYMAFTASSLDGASHAVQVYSDVSGEWNSGDRSQKIVWNSTSNADVIFHFVTLQTQTSEVFTEVIDQAEWGTLYYAMKTGANVTYQIASDAFSRGNFSLNGVLNDQPDLNTRAINDHFAVFAISRDLGTVIATQAPVVWTVGYTTDPAINYSDVSRSLYYKTQYSSDEALIVDFLNDFSNASSRAQQLDNKILQGATSVTSGLGDLVSLAIAQVYGSMQLTVGTDAKGNPDKSDVMMFMKNIGGVKENRVNAVETLYAAFPALMYIDPGLGGLLLEPLFRLQTSRNSGASSQAAADLGSNYPSVSGSSSNSNQGVEQTGNMLIMTYAYARASGDGSLISRYYNLLTSWSNYLIASTLFIHDQFSADNLSVNNQTNLAIKGIIAIQAMSKMSSVVNQTADANKYSTAAANLYAQWKSLALSSDQHLFAAYGQNNSWTLGYNLFADVWLGTNLVESSVYSGHSNFINNIVLTSNFSNFGMPVDSLSTDTTVAVSSWSLFAAAMTTNQGLRSSLISRVRTRASTTTIPGVFPVYYGTTDGSTLQGAASPAQGAVFAPLALKAPVLTINANGTTGTTGASTPHRKRHTGAIVVGIIGGAGAILAVIGIVVFVQCRRRRARPRPLSSFSPDFGSLANVTPFDPSSFEATQDSGSSADRQPLPVGIEDPEAEMVALHRLSPTPPAALPRSRPVVPIPPGLSSKEIARLRAEALSSPQFHSRTTSNTSRSASSPNTVTGSSSGAGSTYRGLHTEVESLVRREMERLRTEGLVLGTEGLAVGSEAPPSYTEGDR